MNIYHTFANLPIIPLNVLTMFAFFRIKPNRSLSVALGALLILLPWAARQYFLLGVPIAWEWGVAIVALFPLYCATVLKLFAFQCSYSGVTFGVMSAAYLTTMFQIVSFIFVSHILELPAGDCRDITVASITVALTLAALVPLRRYVKKYFLLLVDAFDTQDWHVLLLIPMFFLVMYAITGIFYIAPDGDIPWGSLATLAAICIFYLQLYYFLVLRRQNQMLADQIAASQRLIPIYEHYNRELLQQEERIRILRHDFRHILGQVAVIAKEEGSAAMTEYLKNVSCLDEDLDVKAYCENNTVNAIVSFYFSLAARSGTDCRANLAVPENTGLPEAELVMLIGNALENGVRATKPLGKAGRISITAKVVKDCLVFKFANNFREGAYEKGDHLGLASMEMLCAKHAGMITHATEGDEFRLTLVLSLGEARGKRACGIPDAEQLP